MDPQTSSKILTEKITSSVKPKTRYGLKEKENFKLFDSEDKEELEHYLDLVYYIAKNLSQDKLKEIISILSNVNNIEMIIEELRQRSLEVYEIFEIKKYIYHYEKLKKIDFNLPYLQDNLQYLYQLLNPENKNGYTFYVYNRYSKKLQELRKKEDLIGKKIRNEESKLKNKIKEKFDITVLSDEFVVPKSRKKTIENLLNSNLVLMTRETFANIYFSLKRDKVLDELYYEKQHLKNLIQKEEKIVLADISSRLRKESDKIKRSTIQLGKLDFLLAKVEFIQEFRYCKPNISEENFEFKDLIFLPLSKKKNYQPLTFKIPKGLTILVGTNMGGKSTLLKTLGLAEFMLKYGLPIPAEYASMPLLDEIFFVNEDIESDSLSSFAINVERLKDGLKKEKKTLLLIDEFAKGTNPIEGNALAKSVAQWIFENKKNNFTVFATHFMGPVDKKYYLLKVGKIREKFDRIEDAIDHSVNEYEGKFPMEALKISEFIGLNKKIIKNAKECIENDLD
jgi:dsDNA-specific endonuclease/ATPase MutS2